MFYKFYCEAISNYGKGEDTTRSNSNIGRCFLDFLVVCAQDVIAMSNYQSQSSNRICKIFDNAPHKWTRRRSGAHIDCEKPLERGSIVQSSLNFPSKNTTNWALDIESAIAWKLKVFNESMLSCCFVQFQRRIKFASCICVSLPP